MLLTLMVRLLHTSEVSDGPNSTDGIRSGGLRRGTIHGRGLKDATTLTASRERWGR